MCLQTGYHFSAGLHMSTPVLQCFSLSHNRTSDYQLVCTTSTTYTRSPSPSMIQCTRDASLRSITHSTSQMKRSKPATMKMLHCSTGPLTPFSVRNVSLEGILSSSRSKARTKALPSPTVFCAGESQLGADSGFIPSLSTGSWVNRGFLRSRELLVLKASHS